MQCKYFDLNYKIKLFTLRNRDISILSTNIQSLHKNFDFLLDLLENFDQIPDIICPTETKLKDTYSNVNISNYNFFHSPSPTNADGVAMHISTKFAVKSVHA